MFLDEKGRDEFSFMTRIFVQDPEERDSLLRLARYVNMNYRNPSCARIECGCTPVPVSTSGYGGHCENIYLRSRKTALMAVLRGQVRYLRRVISDRILQRSRKADHPECIITPKYLVLLLTENIPIPILLSTPGRDQYYDEYLLTTLRREFVRTRIDFGKGKGACAVREKGLCGGSYIKKPTSTLCFLVRSKDSINN